MKRCLTVNRADLLERDTETDNLKMDDLLTLYLKDGHAVRSMTDFTPVDANVYRLCQLYNDSGVDKIIIFDLSTSDDEHEKNVNTIRNINRNIDIKVCLEKQTH